MASKSNSKPVRRRPTRVRLAVLTSILANLSLGCSTPRSQTSWYDEQQTVSKIPFLGDLPIIGAVFRKFDRNSEPSHLLIFVTVTIIDPDGVFNILDTKPQTLRRQISMRERR